MVVRGLPVVPADGLTDGRVRVSLATAADGPLVQELSRDEAVARWTTYPPDLDSAAAWARLERGLAHEAVALCVAELEGSSAGTCGAQAHADGAVEVFYAVLPQLRRRGVALAATGLLTASAYDAGAREVTLETHADNEASAAVARRAGFLPVQRRLRDVKRDGVESEMVVWRHQAQR